MEKFLHRQQVKAVKPVPYVPFCDLKIPMEIGYGTLSSEIEKIHRDGSERQVSQK